MKSVYILLSRSGTVYSHIVHLVTGGGYTHASLALGRGAERIYSFSRKYAHMPLPSPLVREDVPGGYMARHPRTPCALYRLRVTDGQYDKISQKVEAMLCDGVKYRYSLLGSALCALDIAHERGYHYFCSQFVASPALGERGAGAAQTSLADAPGGFPAREGAGARLRRPHRPGAGCGGHF